MAHQSVLSSVFGETVGTFPSAEFTDLNAFNGQIRVAVASFFHNGFGNPADARAIGSFSNKQYAQCIVTGVTGNLDTLGVGCFFNTQAYNGTTGPSGYRCYLSDGTSSKIVFLDKITGGVAANLGSWTVTWTNGDLLLLEADASSGTSVSMIAYQNSSPLSAAVVDSTSPFLTGNPSCNATSPGDTLRGSVFDSGNIVTPPPYVPVANPQIQFGPLFTF